MELKKNPKADLEKKRGVFFQIGLIISLSILLFAFEYSSIPEVNTVFFQESTAKIDNEIIPITQQEEFKLPPPPPPVVQEIIQIIENNQEIQNEVKVETTELNNELTETGFDAQQEADTSEVIDFFVIEEKPEFPGGEAALMRYISSNVKYPEIPKENGITGKVFILFVINQEGKVTNVELLKGVDPYLDKEALRVVSAMPVWKPGKQRGKPIRVSYKLPINFKL